MQHAATDTPETTHRIASITLDDALIIRRKAEVEHERRTAMDALVDTGALIPASGLLGPYSVFISVRENRLSFRLTGACGSREDISVPLSPLRGVIKDYFLMCESYYAAIPDAGADRIQTLDMARRGVHNEGSEQLFGMISGKIQADFETVRRLFTLICVLHIK